MFPHQWIITKMNGSGNAIGGGAAWCSKRIREPWKRFCSGWAVPSWNVHRWLLPSLSFFFLYRVIRKSVSILWEHTSINHDITKYVSRKSWKYKLKEVPLFGMFFSIFFIFFSFYTEWFVSIDILRRLFNRWNYETHVIKI